MEDHVNERNKLGASFKDDFLFISQDATEKLFRPTVDKIVDHVRKLAPKVQNLQYVILVGGFGQSPYLVDALKEALSPQYHVIMPMSAEISILKGAVLFGSNPKTIVSRISKYTYGHSWYAKFRKNVHDPKRKVVDEKGRELCKNAFNVYIEKGESVAVGERRAFSSVPWSTSDTATTIMLLTSDNRDVLYSDEFGVKHVGNIVIKHPHNTGQHHKIVTTFLFGGTEIEVEAANTAGNNEVIYKTKIDFLD